MIKWSDKGDQHGWLVCPTVSLVTTSHATGLEKTLFLSIDIGLYINQSIVPCILSLHCNYDSYQPACLHSVSLCMRKAMSALYTI